MRDNACAALAAADRERISEGVRLVLCVIRYVCLYVMGGSVRFCDAIGGR